MSLQSPVLKSRPHPGNTFGFEVFLPRFWRSLKLLQDMFDQILCRADFFKCVLADNFVSKNKSILWTTNAAIGSTWVPPGFEPGLPSFRKCVWDLLREVIPDERPHVEGDVVVRLPEPRVDSGRWQRRRGRVRDRARRRRRWRRRRQVVVGRRQRGRGGRDVGRVKSGKHGLKGVPGPDVRIEAKHSLLVLQPLVVQVRVVGRWRQGQVRWRGPGVLRRAARRFGQPEGLDLRHHHKKAHGGQVLRQ